MFKYNDELGYALVTLRRPADGLNPYPPRRNRGPKLPPGRHPVDTRIASWAARGLAWGADQLQRRAMKLFFAGILSPAQTRKLLRVAGRLNRTALTLLQRRMPGHPNRRRKGGSNLGRIKRRFER